jgi:DNA polymerase III subunit epsilon
MGEVWLSPISLGHVDDDDQDDLNAQDLFDFFDENMLGKARPRHANKKQRIVVKDDDDEEEEEGKQNENRVHFISSFSSVDDFYEALTDEMCSQDLQIDYDNNDNDVEHIYLSQDDDVDDEKVVVHSKKMSTRTQWHRMVSKRPPGNLIVPSDSPIVESNQVERQQNQVERQVETEQVKQVNRVLPWSSRKQESESESESENGGKQKRRSRVIPLSWQSAPLQSPTKQRDSSCRLVNRKRGVVEFMADERKQKSEDLESELTAERELMLKRKASFRETGCKYFEWWRKEAAEEGSSGESQQFPEILVVNSGPSVASAFRSGLAIAERCRRGRVVVFDMETTGFGSSDSVVEIGAVEIVDGRRTGHLFQAYCKPSVMVHPLAFMTHRLSDEFLAAQEPVRIVVQHFVDWLGDSMLVGHNVAFDCRMLMQELDRHNIVLGSNPTRAFCTQEHFRRVAPGASASLDDATKHLGIGQQFHRLTHGALIDAELTAALFLHMIEPEH